MPELLSICIPTHNRATYLSDLLASLERALARAGPSGGDIRIYLSDNASADRTAEVAAEFAMRLPLDYHRNETNIGGDRNFEQLIRTTPGTYFWLIGDDDLLVEDVLPRLIAGLRAQAPGLMVLDDLTDAPGAEAAARAAARSPQTFANYTAFVEQNRKTDLPALIAHSLISKNVVRRSSYDSAMHRDTLDGEDLHYAFMYALVTGLARSGESIHVPGWPAIVVRRVGAGGGIPPWVAQRLWRRYYEWLGRRYGHPELTRYGRKLYGPRRQLRAWRKGIEARIKRGVRALKPHPKPPRDNSAA